MIERLSARYFGEKPVIRGTIHMLKNHIIDVSELLNPIKELHTAFDIYSEELEVD